MSVELNSEFYPWSAAFEITLACNMKCMHCGSSAGEERKNLLKCNEWYVIIDDLCEMGCKRFTLSGGEPFLYKHWRDLMSYLSNKKEKIIFDTVTNGTVISEEDIVFMKKVGLDQVGISLDGDKVIHDGLRLFDGAFEKLMNVVSYCKKHNLSYSFITTFNSKNFPIREKLFNIVFEVSPRSWQIQIVNAFGRAQENLENLSLNQEQYRLLVEDIAKWQEVVNNSFAISPADNIGYCHPLTDKLLDGDVWSGCNAGKYVIGIESNGNVKGCLSLQDDFFLAGNVKTQRVKDIWLNDSNFSYTRNFNESKMTGICKQCDSLDICKGGCLAGAFIKDKEVFENKFCYKTICSKGTI